MVERKINAFLGIAFISMTILSYEVLLSRLFSVFIGNPFAYYPISLAFLGMSCAGLYIYLFPRKFIQGDITKPLFYISMLLCIFLTMGIYFFYYITNVFTKKSLDIMMGGSILKGLDYYYTRGVGVSVIGGLILTIPFFLGGLCISLAFRHYSKDISKIYFFDLIGASVGCILIIFLMNNAPMNSLFLLLALVPCCSILFFSLNRSKKSLFVPLAIGLVFLVLFVINLNFKIFEVSADARIWGFQERLKGSYRELWNEWNAYSRVGLVEATYKDGKNMFFGFDSGYGKAHLLKFDEKDPFRLKDEFFVIKYGYALKKPKKVLILFAGVGRDMVYAYAYSDGESDITGVEINPNIIRKAVQLKEYSLDNFFQKPNVKMVVREGRDYINQCKDKFDIIMLSWSGATFAYQAGIASHTSQYLYTVEAFAEYLKHLNSDGLLIILQQNMMRNLTTARQAYEYLGIGELNNKVIIAKESPRMSKKPGTEFWRSPDNDYHIIFKKSDYTNDELDRMDVFLGKNKLSLVYSPKACLPQYVAVKEFLNVQDPKQYVRDFNTKMLANVSPAFDDNPFSMNTYPFSIFFPKAFQKNFLKRPWTNFYLLSNYFLLIIVLITILFSFLFIIIPLIIKGRSQIKKSNLLFIAYFAILGMGFMFVEISLIQRLTLFLGHPIYAISLVLACLLITCGTGSLLSKDLFDRKLLNFKRSASILFFLMFFYIWILPQVLYALISFKLILKVLLVFFIILPLGFFLGMFFPQGLRIVEENDKSFIPWVWGINGTTSVVGTSMAAFLSIFFGFTIVSMLGQLAYFVILLIVMSPSWQRLST